MVQFTTYKYTFPTFDTAPITCEMKNQTPILVTTGMLCTDPVPFSIVIFQFRGVVIHNACFAFIPLFCVKNIYSCGVSIIDVTSATNDITHSMHDTSTPTSSISNLSAIPSDAVYVLIVLFGFCVYHCDYFTIVLFCVYNFWVVNATMELNLCLLVAVCCWFNT